MKIEYISYGSRTDGTNYCSGLETFAENVIEENENAAVLTFPAKNQWARLRSKEYRMTTDNAEAILPLPIYKIKRVLIRFNGDVLLRFTEGLDGVDGLKLSAFTNGVDYLDDYYYIDITPLIVTEEEWQALPLATSESDYINNVRKDNTFVYKTGNDSIKFSGSVYRIGLSVFGGIFADNKPAYERLVTYVLKNYYGDFYCPYVDKKYYLRSIGAEVNEVKGHITQIPDVRGWTVRVEYIPVSGSVKVRARKSAKTEVDFFQPFNQRAEIVEASAFGKSMATTAQKTGVKELTIVKRYSSLAEIPPIGAKVKHNERIYRVSSNSYSMTNTTYIQVVHSLSENWTMKSNHVAVDQKFRNWAIPQETLWRTLFYEEYLHVGVDDKSASDTDAGISIVDVLRMFQTQSTALIGTPISQMCWGMKSDGTYGANSVVVPCTTYGMANNMIFTASFKDTLSAGLRENDGYTCEDVYYCDENGELQEVQVQLSKFIISHDASYFPKSTNSKNTPSDSEDEVKSPKFEKEFLVKKDAGEALRFTYQVSIIADDSRIIIGDKFAENCTLVKAWEGGELYAFIVDDFIASGSDVIPSARIVKAFSASVAGGKGYIELTEGILELYQYAKAWGVCTAQGDIILACNDTSVRTLYLTISKDK